MENTIPCVISLGVSLRCVSYYRLSDYDIFMEYVSVVSRLSYYLFDKIRVTMVLTHYEWMVERSIKSDYDSVTSDNTHLVYWIGRNTSEQGMILRELSVLTSQVVYK